MGITAESEASYTLPAIFVCLPNLPYVVSKPGFHANPERMSRIDVEVMFNLLKLVADGFNRPTCIS